MADIPPYPLYARTYLLYRVSPLHTADASLLSERVLNIHANRLREQLKGDNVRGVEVDPRPTNDALPTLGPLEDCQWHLLGDEDAWIDRHRQLLDPEASHLTQLVSPDQARGIDISLDYEKQSYSALLLRDPKVTTSPPAFTSLPLMLVRMPSAIRDIFLDYIRTTFDAHVAPLSLSSPFITATLETYFRHLSARSSTQSIQDVIRQLQIQLSFPQTTTLLRHLDLTIAARDVPTFLARGRLLRNAKDRPFTVALRAYINSHLALDIFHPKVHLSRITCASFVLGSDRLKLMAPDITDASVASSDIPEGSGGELAVRDFYVSLVKEASATAKFLKADLTGHPSSSTPSPAMTPRAERRKRAVSNVDAGSGTTKRSKPRAKDAGMQSHMNGFHDHTQYN